MFFREGEEGKGGRRAPNIRGLWMEKGGGWGGAESKEACSLQDKKPSYQSGFLLGTLLEIVCSIFEKQH